MLRRQDGNIRIAKSCPERRKTLRHTRQESNAKKARNEHEESRTAMRRKQETNVKEARHCCTLGEKPVV